MRQRSRLRKICLIFRYTWSALLRRLNSELRFANASSAMRVIAAWPRSAESVTRITCASPSWNCRLGRIKARSWTGGGESSTRSQRLSTKQLKERWISPEWYHPVGVYSLIIGLYCFLGFFLGAIGRERCTSQSFLIRACFWLVRRSQLGKIRIIAIRYIGGTGSLNSSFSLV